ncbi:MAG: exodeoxyribonuclease V subunit gamma, partial [Neisseria sp.]|nr:exodeoxyribonuclease V subunit gamma [Neisseria sp.]
YSVSDVKLSRRQPLLYALEQTLDLLESRFEVDKVLPLLESGLVLRRFGLTADDLPLLHDTIAELNVHWGLDGTMRGAADNLFTWRQALERIVLGWMLPDDGSPLWQNVSAWHGDVNRLDVFGRFAAFIRTLPRLAAEWRKPAAAEEWTERCRVLVQSLFLPDADDQYALQQFEQALAKWQEETALAGFSGTLPQHTVIRHIRRFLGSESQAGFLRGGITFCSMVPMRSLPFKVICLLGLNDGDFPRNTKAAVFDLIAKHPQKGDRARRDDDRYLFLEAIISARDILYLSYVGRSIRNDDELAPSALVSELIDTVAAMAGRRSKELAEHWVEQHPLQPFSHRYFIADKISDDLFSTRQDYAEALNRPREQARPFFSEALEENSPAPTVWQDDFIRFWKNPVKAWLQQTLGWREPYRDEAWESAEPFEPQRANKIAAAYLDARRHNQDFQETAVRLDAESLLPAGELGKLWQQNFQAAAKRIDSALLQSPKLPPFAYEIPFDGQTLQGSLGNLYQCGQVFYLDRKPNAPQRIALLLEHLIFCAVESQTTETRQTHIVQPEETTTYPEISGRHAQQMLQKWLTFFNLGQTRPLPFFAKTSLAAAEAYGKKQSWEDALNKAKESYHGNKVSKGQKDYTEVALVFGNEDTEPVEGALFQRLVEELLIPLLDAVKEESSDAT